jgi:hypothetical protein
MSTYHVTDDEANGPPVADGELERLQLAHALVTLGVCLNTSALQTVDSDHAFAVGQALGVGGEIEKEEVGADSPDDGGRTLNNEQPSPSAQSASSLHSSSDGSSKKTTECARKDSGGDVDTETLRLFLLLVPRRDNEEDTGRETSFENTDQNAECEEVLVVFDDGHDAGEATPDDHDSGKVDGRLDADEKHVGRRLEDDIGDEENYQTNGVLFRSQLQVVCHTGNLCIANARVVLAAAKRDIGFGAYFVRSMYESKYINQIVGKRKRSIFLTSFFSSSGVHVNSPETSICLVVSISLRSAPSNECGVEDIFVSRGLAPNLRRAMLMCVEQEMLNSR